MSTDAAFPIALPWETVKFEIEALSVFKTSPFYSTACNNESPLIRKNDLGKTELKQMVGLEYEVDLGASSPPELWIINQQYRTARDQVQLQKVFYLLHGTIYQAPSFGDLIESRLSKATHHINDALDELSAFKPCSVGSDGELSGDGASAAAATSLPGQGEGVGFTIMEVLGRSASVLHLWPSLPLNYRSALMLLLCCTGNTSRARQAAAGSKGLGVRADARDTRARGRKLGTACFFVLADTRSWCSVFSGLKVTGRPATGVAGRRLTEARA